MADRVLVCGSRSWTDYDPIFERLFKLHPDTMIIHGGCRGADMLADRAARELGLHIAQVDALWEYYGKSAGPIRNRKMLSLKPVLVIAFKDHGLSRGTANMIR